MIYRRAFLGAALLLSACSGTSDANRIQPALDGMRSQVASDIDITVDQSSLTLHNANDRRYVVCGKAELNRPSDDPRMRHDHETQRFIIHVHNSGAIITEFDGSHDEAGQIQFEKDWKARCNS